MLLFVAKNITEVRTMGQASKGKDLWKGDDLAVKERIKGGTELAVQ